MRDYPNMSYCMVENTLAAMRQVMNAMYDNDEFLKDLNRSEAKNFKYLLEASTNFNEMASYLLENDDE